MDLLLLPFLPYLEPAAFVRCPYPGSLLFTPISRRQRSEVGR